MRLTGGWRKKRQRKKERERSREGERQRGSENVEAEERKTPQDMERAKQERQNDEVDGGRKIAITSDEEKGRGNEVSGVKGKRK